ncbi:hypothetical protein PINS_up021568, partial [Pythium insidiosum]
SLRKPLHKRDGRGRGMVPPGPPGMLPSAPHAWHAGYERASGHGPAPGMMPPPGMMPHARPPGPPGPPGQPPMMRPPGQ